MPYPMRLRSDENAQPELHLNNMLVTPNQLESALPQSAGQVMAKAAVMTTLSRHGERTD